MASTAEDQARLLVSIEATQKKFEKQLAVIAKQAGTTATGIENTFKRANDNAGKGFERGARQATKSLGASRAAAQNLGFQLNDIATQLASGTSPLRVMAQQGGQVAQALQGAGGAAGAVKALGGAFAGLLNPIGLVSIALIGITGYAAQYLTSLVTGGEDANKTLKNQTNIIQEVADKWGDLLPAVREYANELKAQKTAADQSAAVQQTITHLFEDSKKALSSLKGELAGTATQFYQIGDASGSFDDLGNKFYEAQLSMANLEKKVREGKAETKDFNAVIDDLSDLLGTDAVKANSALVRALTDLKNGYTNAAKAAADLVEQQTMLTGLPGKTSSAQGPEAFRRAQIEFDRILAERRRFHPDDFPQAETENAGKSIGKAAAKEIKNSFDSLSGGAVRNFVNQVVKAESGGVANAKNPNSSATGLGQFIESTWLKLFKENFPDRAKSMSDQTILALRKDADISRQLIEAYAQQNANLLRQAGVAVNEAALHLAHFLGPQGAIAVLTAKAGTPVSQVLSQQAIKANPTILGGGATVDDVIAYGNKRANIEADYKAATAAAKEFDAAQRAAAQTADQLGTAVGGALKGLVDAFADGKLEASELLSIVVQLASQLMRMPGGALSGGSFLGGILGAFFHDGGVVGGPAKTKAMSPGTWSGAKRYHKGGIAGLQPGEVPAILQRGEIVIPRGARMGGGGQSIVINAPINAPGADAAQLARVEASVKELGKNIPKMVDRRVDTRQTRGTRP